MAAEPDSSRARKAAHEEPEWTNLSGSEVEELVVKLARDGTQAAEIGVILRDQYAVPDIQAATGKSVGQLLEDNDLTPPVPEDLLNLMTRAVNLREHLRENPKDTKNRRGLQQIESRVRRLAKYYREQGTLPYDWYYSEDMAKMIIE